MAAPERKLVRPVSKGISQNRGCWQADANLRIAYGAGDRATMAGDGDPASNSVRPVAARVTVGGAPDRRRLSGKAARYVERLALLYLAIA